VSKTTVGLVGVCGLAVAAWAVPVLRVGGKAAEGAEPAAPVRWECAELRVTTHSYWNVANTGEDEPKPEVVLNLPDKAHKSETLAGLPLGKKPNPETAAGVLSTLGQDGWEPAGFAATEWVNPGRAIKRVEVWVLKRPARK
jgi:hypothetical protein